MCPCASPICVIALIMKAEPEWCSEGSQGCMHMGMGACQSCVLRHFVCMAVVCHYFLGWELC